MRDTITKQAGLAVAAVLSADGLMHLYWATGRVWPASSPESLSLAVLNIDVPFTPPVVVPLATTLFLGATLVLARANYIGRFSRFIPVPLAQSGTIAVATGLALRGLAGLVWTLGIGTDTSTPFYWLNLMLYTPLCLVLTGATILVARTPQPRHSFGV